MSSDSNRYAVELTDKAAKELAKLEAGMQTKVRLALDLLASNPRPPRALKLVNSDSFRVRIGNYRIIYKVFESKLVVIVIRIAHRGNAYRS